MWNFETLKMSMAETSQSAQENLNTLHFKLFVYSNTVLCFSVFLCVGFVIGHGQDLTVVKTHSVVDHASITGKILLRDRLGGFAL